jgi:hypothetical protein
MSQVVADLLSRLAPKTRRGAVGEVETQRPLALEAPDRVPARPELRQAAAARLRLAQGTYTAEDVAWAREATRSPYVVTRVEPYCRDCPYRGRPVTYLGVQVADDCCEHDGVCARADADEEARLRSLHGGQVPLWARRYRPSLIPYLHARPPDKVAA